MSQIILDDQLFDIEVLIPPTFVTIDMGFWDKGLRDVHYCILCFPLRNDEQHQLPALLRRLLQLPEFRTKAERMGKVARVSPSHVEYWRMGDEQSHRLHWSISEAARR